MEDFLKGGAEAGVGAGAGNQKINEVWRIFVQKLMENPTLLLATVQEAQRKQMEIMSHTSGEELLFKAPRGDRRFNAEQWHTNPLYSMLMQNYLLNSETLRTLADSVDMPEKDKKILQFAVNQYIDAMAPTNFPVTNPEVMEEAIKTGGESLAQGMQNFMRDAQSGNMVQNTDVTAFSIGENIATTPGQVVLQTPLMQLIEYAPQTPRVQKRPLLIVPPCINKYYILDLTAEKSLVAHLLASGQRVFLISWVNAGEAVRNAEWDDYLRDGVMAAIDAVQNITRQEKINTMGFCIGGTLLASALAALAANGEQPAQTVSLLAAMLDFSDTGEIGLFIDEESVAAREAEFAEGGLMNGRDLAKGFAALRPNDLVWPYVIGNYYQGKKPPAFDLLFWNADSTNLPGPMFAQYLRQTYLENQISRGCAEMCGEAIDIGSIDASVFAVACEKDHIVPWQTAYLSTKLFSKDAQFVLAASGHIAGVVNPPASGKGWHISGANKAANGADWRTTAQHKDGSWWQEWFAFLAKHGGGAVAAPQRIGNVRYPPLEDAPGSYVSIPRPLLPGEQGDAQVSADSVAAAKPRRATSRPVVAKSAAKKKTAVKKTAAKKVTKKKVVTKKAAKKPAAKKRTVKKTAPTKTVAKKRVAQKRTTKK